VHYKKREAAPSLDSKYSEKILIIIYRFYVYTEIILWDTIINSAGIHKRIYYKYDIPIYYYNLYLYVNMSTNISNYHIIYVNTILMHLSVFFIMNIIYYKGTEWPSGLKRRLRRAPSTVRTSVTGVTSGENSAKLKTYVLKTYCIHSWKHPMA